MTFALGGQEFASNSVRARHAYCARARLPMQTSTSPRSSRSASSSGPSGTTKTSLADGSVDAIRGRRSRASITAEISCSVSVNVRRVVAGRTQRENQPCCLARRDLGDGGLKRERTQGGEHPATVRRWHKKPIVENFAEACEPRGQGRMLDIQALRGSRDIQLRQQRVQREVCFGF
jgi:hypothetical protein